MKPSLQVAVDATTWLNKRGYGRYTRAILTELVRLDEENQYTFFIDSDLKPADFPEHAGLHLVDTSAPTTVAASAEGHRSLKDIWRMGHALSSLSYDLVLFPTIYSYVPIYSHARIILFIHDIIPERFPKLSHPAPFPRLLWHLKSVLARRQADIIVTVSEYSRKKISAQFHIPVEKIYVVGEAPDWVFRKINNPTVTPVLDKLGLPHSGRMIIYIGGFGPHKNLINLINVFHRLVSQEIYSDLCLMMVGEYQHEVFYSISKQLSTQIEEMNLSNQVKFTGYIPDEDLVLLLNMASVLVLPSLMEGFGLPAVEAAACGCPVIATIESPLPDILGAGGLFINPTLPNELESALISVLDSTELRKKMQFAGMESVRKLSWVNSARQLKNVITEIKPVH